MFFPGAVNSTALHHNSANRKSKKSIRSVSDEMSEVEDQPAPSKGFLRLNSLEEEDENESTRTTCSSANTEDMPCSTLDTPKRRQQLIQHHHKHHPSSSIQTFHHHRKPHRHFAASANLNPKSSTYHPSYQYLHPPPSQIWWTNGYYQHFQHFHSPLFHGGSHHLSQHVPLSYNTNSSLAEASVPRPLQHQHFWVATPPSGVAENQSFQLATNFVPELSFADHAAMAAAAMESEAAETAESVQRSQCYTSGLLSSQITKTFSSIVGGVCSWVAGSLDFRIGGGRVGSVVSDISSTTTAASSMALNPNAKSFVPLNPNAKEFHPKGANSAAAHPDPQSVPQSHQELKTPSPERPSGESDLKPVAERKGTPWVCKPHPPSDTEASFDDDFDSPIARCESSDDEDSDSEDEEDDFHGDTLTRRIRQISVGSDDSDFIVFEDACPMSGEANSRTNCDTNRDFDSSVPVVSMKDFIFSPVEEDDDDDVEDYSDQVDNASVERPDEVLAMFQCNLTLDRLTSPSIKPAAAGIGSDSSVGNDVSRIRTANQSWNDFYDGDVDSSLERSGQSSKGRGSACKVCFDEGTNVVIYEDPDLSEELAASRLSDFPQRQADKERMERLIGPILTELHRDKVRRRLLESTPTP